MPKALLVLSLLVFLSLASAEAAAVAKPTAIKAVPLRVVVLGPIRALPAATSTKAMAQPPADSDSDTGDTDTSDNVVSARSFVLGNNITISQSRLFLSRLDQLFLLRKLLDTIDLAPKLASATDKLSTMGRGAPGAQEQLEDSATDSSSSFAEGFLFELERAKLMADDDANVLAVVDVAGSKLGFGWRYPLSYWNQLAGDDKPKCAFGKTFGRFYYC